MQKRIIEIEKEFIGTGEVKNMRFLRLYDSKQAYLYRVGVSNYHYEVFERKNAPVCVDYQNRIYSETDFMEIYPKKEHFGIWAWTCTDLSKAIEKFNRISGKPVKTETHLIGLS